MSLLTRGSVIAVSLMVGGCVTSMLGGGSDAADAKTGTSPTRTETAAAAPAPASTDQAWAGRDLPDYRTTSAAGTLSADAFATTPPPSSAQLGMAPAARPAPAPASTPAMSAAAASPPPARPEPAAPPPAPVQTAAAQSAAAPPPAQRQAQPTQQLAQAQQAQRNAPQGGQAQGGQAQGRPPQNGQGRNGPTEEQLEQVVQAYAGVTGGFYLNEKCSVLNAAQKREYEWHLSVLTAALSQQVRPDILDKARGATRQNVAEQFKECGDNAKRLVGEAFTASQRMNKSITGATYQGKESDIQLALNKFGAVTMVLTVEKHCERVPEPTRARIYSAYEEVSASLAKQGAADQVKQIRARATEQVDGAFSSGKVTKEQACDARGTQQLQPALNELKRMQCEIAGSKQACAEMKS